MTDAVAAIDAGCSIRRAARNHGVNKASVHYRLKQCRLRFLGFHKKDKISDTYFTEDEELVL